MTKATKATPPPKKDEFLWAAIGVSLVSLVALVACMVSDGCPRQRTSKTFPINRTEFKKSFLWQQAQPIVILSMGSQPYGMAVNPERIQDPKQNAGDSFGLLLQAPLLVAWIWIPRSRHDGDQAIEPAPTLRPPRPLPDTLSRRRRCRLAAPL